MIINKGNETGNDARNALKECGMEYYLLFRIGEGMGAETDQLLSMSVEDIAGQNDISMHVGPKKIQRTYVLPEDLQKELSQFTAGRSGKLFIAADGTALLKEQVKTVFKKCGLEDDFLAQVMRRYYDETGDIYYPMNFMGFSTEDEALAALSCTV